MMCVQIHLLNCSETKMYTEWDINYVCSDTLCKRLQTYLWDLCTAASCFLSANSFANSNTNTYAISSYWQMYQSGSTLKRRHTVSEMLVNASTIYYSKFKLKGGFWCCLSRHKTTAKKQSITILIRTDWIHAVWPISSVCNYCIE